MVFYEMSYFNFFQEKDSWKILCAWFIKQFWWKHSLNRWHRKIYFSNLNIYDYSKYIHYTQAYRINLIMEINWNFFHMVNANREYIKNAYDLWMMMIVLKLQSGCFKITINFLISNEFYLIYCTVCVIKHIFHTTTLTIIHIVK